jgi:hypothetical protein
MDNSKTKKEGISPIHNGQEGYAVMAAYLGTEGWCLELELVKGSQHCREGFIPFLLRAIEKARALTSQLLLLPLDSAHDVRDIRLALRGQKHVSYVINWNPRREDKLEWAERVFKEGKIITQRPGKRVGLLDVHTRHGLNPYEFRHIVRAVECTIDHLGHLLLVPENDIEGWCTNLGLPTKRVIGVYENHGKSEQFNREIKSDLDMERLPSGKLATNALVLTLGGLAYNVLRAIGQFGLFEAQTPVRHPAKRYQIKTVIQELMYLTARLVRTGRRLKLVFSRHCPAFEAFRTIYTRLASEQSSKGD